MRRAATLAAVLGAAGVIAGCGGGSSSPARTETVERATRVEVVREVGARSGGFDPQALYERESPGVVTILAAGFADAAQSDSGLGSGFVVSGDGEIATNAHVVTSGTGAALRPATTVYVRFADRNQVPARIVGVDPFSDVALLRIDPKGLTLRPLPLGEIADVHVGEPVAAIGSPFGEESSLSIGVVSALGRSIESLTGFQTDGAIQTDAAINRGNSGGPLLDAHGRVLGINSQIRTGTGAGSGVGFAVPIDVVRRSLDALRRDGRVRYPYLGISSRNAYPQLADRFGLPADHGAWIQDLVDGGPAEQAGLRAGDDRQRFQESEWRVGGDLVTRLGDHELRDEGDLGAGLLDYDPGDVVALEVWRDGRRLTIEVRLGTRPLDAPRG